jgi:hypothetical protein
MKLLNSSACKASRNRRQPICCRNTRWIISTKISPQRQAQLLLERSINHYQGANEQIAGRVDSWRGKIKIEGSLNSIFMTALNSDDLRVRAAAIEIDLAARNVKKDAAAVDRLENVARSGEQGPRVNALWDIALLGNRGIEPIRAGEILRDSVHDPKPCT